MWASVAGTCGLKGQEEVRAEGKRRRLQHNYSVATGTCEAETMSTVPGFMRLKSYILYTFTHRFTDTHEFIHTHNT